MKTCITFINIKQVSTPLQPIIQLYNPQSVQCQLRCAPGAHCTALALTNTNKINNLKSSDC